jgi:GNAT superfamily N-acetyltransferase
MIPGVDFELRAARETDIVAIRACYLRSWRAAYAGFLPPDVVDAVAEQRRSFDWGRGIGADTSTVLVAVDDDRVLGVVQADEILPPPRDRPEIVMLYVDPDAWGSGVATALLHHGVAWIAGRGHRDARLRVVEAHTRARRFYEREGWTPDPRLAPARNDFFRLLYSRRPLDDRVGE